MSARNHNTLASNLTMSTDALQAAREAYSNALAANSRIRGLEAFTQGTSDAVTVLCDNVLVLQRRLDRSEGLAAENRSLRARIRELEEGADYTNDGASDIAGASNIDGAPGPDSSAGE